MLHLANGTVLKTDAARDWKSKINLSAMIPGTWKRNQCQISSCRDSPSRLDSLFSAIVPLWQRVTRRDVLGDCPWRDPWAWAQVAPVGVGGNLRWPSPAIPRRVLSWRQPWPRFVMKDFPWLLQMLTSAQLIIPRTCGHLCKLKARRRSLIYREQRPDDGKCHGKRRWDRSWMVWHCGKHNGTHVYIREAASKNRVFIWEIWGVQATSSCTASSEYSSNGWFQEQRVMKTN